MNDITDRLVEMVRELLVMERREVRPDSLLVSELDVDSMTLMELIFSIEKEFDVEFPDVKTSEELFAATLPAALEKMPVGNAAPTLFQFIVRTGLAPAAPSRDAASALSSQTIGGLAAAIGGRVPTDLEPSSPLAALHLGQLLRVVTVETMARYVAYLQTVRALESSGDRNQ